MMSNELNNMVTSIVTGGDGSCLCKIANSYVFPIYSIASQCNWKQQACADIKQACGLEVSFLQIHKWFKILSPSSSNSSYVTSIVFSASIALEQKRKCQLAPGYVWVFPNDMSTFYEKRTITNPVLCDFYPKLKSIVYDSFADQFWVFGVIVEVTVASMIQKRGTPSEILIQGTDFMVAQKEAFVDFFAICQPNVLMSHYHFIAFMAKFGVQGSWVSQLFRAVDNKNCGFVTFRNVAYLLAIMAPETDHFGPAGEVRKRILFQMFDTDHDSLLSRQETEALIEFIRLPNDPDTRSCIFMMKLNNPAKKLTFEEFCKNIDQVLLNALSSCLRAKRTCRMVYGNNIKRSSTGGGDAVIDSGNEFQDRIQLDKRKTFALSSHTFRVVKSKNILNVEDIWSIKNICSYETLRQAGLTRELRRFSCEINAPTLVYNEQITKLRYLLYLNKIRGANQGSRLEDYDWGTTSEAIFGQKLIQICATTKKIVMGEKRLLELKPPAYILGSLHGNIGDLTAFEKIMWQRTPGHSPGCVLFLGNYVDREPFGIEVVTLLFCYKSMFPKKVYLMRGCHEIRKVQLKDCFQKECISKFGRNLGLEVWEAVNSVFDCMPLAAVVDDKILCVHSGIPQPIVCTLTKFFNNIPCSLPDPEKTSELAWELLWNEPASELQRKQNNKVEIDVEGFIKNTKRGTGYTFSPEALHTFLDTNFYTHLIRTNEPVPYGFSLADKAHVITVFSSSHYNEKKNDSGCLILDQGLIRVVRLSLEAEKHIK